MKASELAQRYGKVDDPAEAKEFGLLYAVTLQHLASNLGSEQSAWEIRWEREQARRASWEPWEQQQRLQGGMLEGLPSPCPQSQESWRAED